jgi:predicted XRE-type DNA-binding protein
MPSLEVLDECALNELDACESEAIEIFDSVKNGFNTKETATHRSELFGELAGNSKYTNAQVQEVFMYLVDNVLTHREISEITGMSRGAVSDISSGTSHLWLNNIYPIEYAELLRLKGTIRRSNKMTAENKNKEYPLVVSPIGLVYAVQSLRGFCRQHNLNHGSFGEMLRGRRAVCSGWKLAVE